jgi:uncharacterized membrane protein
VTRLDDVLRILLRCAALAAIAVSSATVAEYFMNTATFCEPGGGCDEIRAWARANQWGLGLPILGVVGFTVLFTGSIFRHRATLRLTALFAILGGLIAIALIALQSDIGAYCWLCLTVDSIAILCGVLGAVLLARSGRADPEVQDSLVTPWWSLWVLAAFVPIAWGLLSPDADIPDNVRARYRDGAVNVLEMADFECPYCREMHPVLKQTLEGVDDVNLVRIVVPLPFHRQARDASRAYLCAERMGKGDEMADALFASENLSREGLFAHAAELGLDEAEFSECYEDRAIEAEIREHERFAREANMQGLPTVYIGERAFVGFNPNGGGEEFREAVVAAQQGEGARTVIWPMAAVVVLALLLGIAAFAKRRPDQP